MSRNEDLDRRLALGGVIFDGAIGSMLIAEGLAPGQPPEHWNLTNPAALIEIHRAYLEAGAQILTTNTFGSTPSRLQRHGLSAQIEDINRAGVRLARQAAEGFTDERSRRGDETGDRAKPLVALSLGPTTMMLPPLGDATEASIAGEFEAQLSGLAGGFDLVVVETMYDLREALIALTAAREHTKVPVAVSMTYNKTPRGFFTVMGDEAEATLRRLEAAGPDVIGGNCSISSAEMLDLAPVLRAATGLPVLCQPNAGQPRMAGTTPVYDQSPEAFAADADRLFDLGVNAVGGCCGTTPEFIRRLCARRRGRPRS